MARKKILPAAGGSRPTKRADVPAKEISAQVAGLEAKLRRANGRITNYWTITRAARGDDQETTAVALAHVVDAFSQKLGDHVAAIERRLTALESRVNAAEKGAEAARLRADSGAQSAATARAEAHKASVAASDSAAEVRQVAAPTIEALAQLRRIVEELFSRQVILEERIAAPVPATTEDDGSLVEACRLVADRLDAEIPSLGNSSLAIVLRVAVDILRAAAMRAGRSPG